MPSTFKDKLDSCQKNVSNFMKPLKTIDFHLSSGINEARFCWNNFALRACPTHYNGYDIGCPHCHHHNASPPNYFPPGPPGSGYPRPGPPGGGYPPPGPPGGGYRPSYPPGSYPPPPSSPGYTPSAPSPYQPSYQPTYPSHPYYWLDSHISAGVPPQAFEGGHDADGQRIYVGRAFHDGDWLIAKVIPGKRAAYISFNGDEIFKDRYQVLCGSGFYWQPDSEGRVPPRAVQGGRTSSGEPLYVGRAHHAGSLTVGKIHPSHRVCYIPFDGKENSHHHYEVLVSTQ